MSCNIYEEPKCLMEVRYKGAGEETEEALVDIYEGFDAGDLPPHRGLENAVGGKACRAAVLILGLLCLLLLGAVAVLSRLSDMSDVPKRNTTLLDARHRCDCCCGAKQEKVPPTANSTEEKLAPEGWVGTQSACYYRSSEPKTWSDSRTECRSRGADLVVVDSKDEQEFVSSLGKPGEFWIGLRSEKRSWHFDWKWVDSSFLSYTSWAPGVNTRPKSEVNAFLGSDGNWNHTTNGTKGWICEKFVYMFT